MVLEPVRLLASYTQRLAIFGLGSCALLNIYSTQPILLKISEEFQVGASTSAWTISATTLGVALAAPLAGIVSDRFGRKSVMATALAALIAMTLACALAWNFMALLSLRFAQGLLVPFIFTAALAYIVEEWSPATAANMNSVYVAGTAFGGFCGRFAAGATAAMVGWRSAFLLPGCLLMLVLVGVLCGLPSERQFKSSVSLSEGFMGLIRGLRNWRVLATCLVGADLLFQQVVSFTYVGLHLAESPFMLSPLQIGSLFVVFLFAVVTTPLFGQLIRRIGRSGTFILSQLAGITGILVTLSTHLAFIISGLALSCVAVFAGQACATGYIAEKDGGARSAMVGLYLTSYYLGGSIGAVAPAPLYATSGWTACASLLIVTALVSIAVAVTAWRGATSLSE